MSGQKRCTKCKREKRLTEFSKDARYRLGRKSWCRECDRAQAQAYDRAMARLREAHRDEFDALYDQELVRPRRTVGAAS